MDERDEELVRKIKRGAHVLCDVRQPRNPAHHRKFWALCDIIYANTDFFPDVECVADRLKVWTGHCRYVHRPDGEIERIANSIAYASLDQTAFAAFYDKVIRLTVTQIIPRLDEGLLRKELEEICA